MAGKKPLAAFQNDVEDRRRIGDRTADGGQHLARGPLLVERLSRLVEQSRVLDRDSHVGCDGAQQMLVGLVEPALRLGALHADDANRLASHHDGDAEIGLGEDTDALHADRNRGFVQAHVDQQRLRGLENLAGEALTDRHGRKLVAVHIREEDCLARFVEQRDVNNIGAKRVAHLFADNVNQRVEIEL